MISLYMSITGGVDWHEVSSVFDTLGTRFYFLFMAYVGFYHIVVVNALTSLFVELTIEQASRDQDNATNSALESTDTYMQKLSTWFMVVDEDQSGTIEWDEFTRHPE